MSSSIIEDFAGIAERLKQIKQEESDKPKVEVEDGKPSDWANVYGTYGWPSNVPPDMTAVRQNIWGIAYLPSSTAWLGFAYI